jgi:hypothetical protein
MPRPARNPIDPMTSAEAVTTILGSLDTTRASPKEREAVIAVQRQYRQEYLFRWKQLVARQRLSRLVEDAKRLLGG